MHRMQQALDLLKVRVMKVTSLRALALLEPLPQVIGCLLMPTGNAQSSSQSEDAKVVHISFNALSSPWNDSRSVQLTVFKLMPGAERHGMY